MERSTLLGVFIVLFALGLGASAGLLGGFQVVSTPAANHVPPSLGLLGWLLVSFFLCAVMALIVVKVLRGNRTKGGLPFQGGVALLCLVLTCLVVIGYMLLASRLPGLSYAGNLNVGEPAGGNGTSGGGPGGNGSGSHFNSTPGVPGPPVPTPPIPPIVVPLTIGIVLAIVLIPVAAVLVRRLTRVEEELLAPSPELIDKLQQALEAFREASFSEARGLIIQAYSILLENLEARYVPDLDSATPREIDQVLVKKLGLSSPSATALRELFEEARYSVHEMRTEQGERARASLVAILTELRSKEHRAATTHVAAGLGGEGVEERA